MNNARIRILFKRTITLIWPVLFVCGCGGNSAAVAGSACGMASTDPPPAEPQTAALLTLDPTVARPDEQLSLSWAVPDGTDFQSGDEYLVECWTDSGWQQAWLVVDAYNNFEGVRAIAITPNVTTSSDAFDDRNGLIPIPVDVPEGTYRVTVRNTHCAPTGMCEARFVVT